MLRAAGRRLLRCPICDLVFVPSQDHLSADAARARYRQHRNSIEDAGYVDMLRRPLELLRQYGQEIRRVLDYGCGPSPVLVELMIREGYDASGYDPLFASDTVLTPPYDAVTCIETFEHFAEPREEISRIVGLLRPGGCLVVSTLLHSGPDAFADWWYARDATHVAFYSSRTLDWIAGALGLQVLFCDVRRLAVLKCCR